MKTPITVGPQRIVAMRYVMSNHAGEELVNILGREPVTFTFGCGDIHPGLENPLEGLKAGEEKNFVVSPESCPAFQETMHFKVIIDDIRWTDASHSATSKPECGPGCNC